MKKRISLLIVFALVLSLVFTMVACNKTVPVTGVTLDVTTASITVGQTKTLTATVNPTDATDKSVTWSSSATAVATVSSTGVVTAVAEGTATITVATTDGDFKATCAVTVTPGAVVNVSVTGVTLNKASTSIVAGGSETLTATVAPSNASNKTVSWASSATAVATVDNNGKVTAVAAGTATITVTTADGAKTATCAVTVTANTGAITGVTLNKSKVGLMMDVGFTTQTLVATIAPAGASGTVVWSSSNTSVATVANGVVTAKATGRTTITATVGTFKAEAQVLVGNYTGSYDGVARTTTNGHIEVVVLTHMVAGVERIQDIIINDAYSYLAADETRAKVSTTTPTTTGTYATNWNNNLTDYINSLIDLSVNQAKAIKIDPKSGTSKDLNLPVNNPDFTKPETTASTGQSFSILIQAVQDAFNATTAKSVSLDQDSIELAIPQTGVPVAPATLLTAQLNATIGAGADKTITWVSSNPEVATVKDGKVTAISAGKTTVYVFTNNGRYSKCDVTVVNKIATFVLYVTSTPAGTRVVPTDTVNLQPQITMTDGTHITDVSKVTFKWESSDKKVATVAADTTIPVVKQNAVITAVAPGTAVITGTATTGSDVKTVTYTITVSANYGVTNNVSTIEFQKEKAEEVQIVSTVNHNLPIQANQFWEYTYAITPLNGKTVVSVNEKGIASATGEVGSSEIVVTATLWTTIAPDNDIKAQGVNPYVSSKIVVTSYETIKGVAILDAVDGDDVDKIEFAMNEAKSTETIYGVPTFHEVSPIKGTYEVKYEWKSSDASVVSFNGATVKDGVATLAGTFATPVVPKDAEVIKVGPGTATITLKITTGAVSKSISIPVTVYGLVIDQGDIGIVRGMGAQEIQLTTTLTEKNVEGGVNVTWSLKNAADEDILTVSKTGLVKVNVYRAADTTVTPNITEIKAEDGTATVVGKIIVGGVEIYTTEIEVTVITVKFTGLPGTDEFDADGYYTASLAPVGTLALTFDVDGTNMDVYPAANVALDFDKVYYEISLIQINTPVATAAEAGGVVTITGVAAGRAVVEITIDFEYAGVEYQLVYTVVVIVA